MTPRDLNPEHLVTPARTYIVAALALGVCLVLAGCLLLQRQWSVGEVTWNPLSLGPFTWFSQVLCACLFMVVAGEQKLLKTMDLEVAQVGEGLSGLGLTARQALTPLFIGGLRPGIEDQDHYVRALHERWERTVASRVWMLWLGLTGIPILAAFDAVVLLRSPHGASMGASCLLGIWLGTLESAGLGYWIFQLGRRWQNHLQCFQWEWDARMQEAFERLKSDDDYSIVVERPSSAPISEAAAPVQDAPSAEACDVSTVSGSTEAYSPVPPVASVAAEQDDFPIAGASRLLEEEDAMPVRGDDGAVLNPPN